MTSTRCSPRRTALSTTPDVQIPFLPKYEAVRATGTDGLRHYDTPVGRVPSVTTILSNSRDNSAIEQWRESIGEQRANEITEAACWRGDKHHLNIEHYFGTGKIPRLNMVTAGYWKSSFDFLQQVRHPLVCEGAIWHPKRYAGAFDCLAYLDDDTDMPTLLDWKTADAIRKPDKMYDYAVQVAAYRAAANWVYAKQGLMIRRAVIVVAIRNSPPQIEWVEEDALDQLFQHFLARLERFYL